MKGLRKMGSGIIQLFPQNAWWSNLEWRIDPPLRSVVQQGGIIHTFAQLDTTNALICTRILTLGRIAV